jgi:hypothetical protein
MSKKSKKRSSSHNRSQSIISSEVEGQFTSRRYEDDSESEDEINNKINAISGIATFISNHEYCSDSDSSSSSSSDSDSDSDSDTSDDEPMPRHHHSGKHHDVKSKKGSYSSVSLAVESKPEITQQKTATLTPIKYFIVEDSVSEKCQNKLDKIMSTYKENNPSIVVTPNWSEGASGIPPSGFALMVDAKTPISTINFDPMKYNTGTSVIKLNGARFVSGEKVDLASLVARKDKIMTQLNTKFDSGQAKFVNPTKDIVCESGGYDSKKWNPSVHDDTGGFVSLDYTTHKNENGTRSSDYWLRVRTGVTASSEEIFQHIEDTMNDNESLSNEKKTWSAVFHDNAVNSLEKAIERNRHNVAYEIAESIGIDMSTLSGIREDEKSKSGHKMLEPVAESITNKVYFTSNGKAIYTRGNVMIEHSKKALVLNESPLMGAHILKGPDVSISYPYGGQWSKETKQKSLEKMTFPADTGRVKSRPDSIEKIETDSQFFTWKGGKSRDYNPKLAPELYRKRDSKFIQKETELGRDHSWGQIELVPLISKISGA